MKQTGKYFIGIALLALSCKPKVTEPNYTMGDVDASLFVAVGNGYVQGFMDDALSNEGQVNSVPNILNKQFNLISDHSFEQYLVNESSVGVNLDGNAPLIMGYKTDCNGETALSPVRAASSGDLSIISGSIYNPGSPVHNFGIEGAVSLEFTTSSATANNPFMERISSNPGVTSIADQASALNPKFYLFAMGEADILNYAKRGGYQMTIMPAAGGAGGWDLESISQEILDQLEVSATSGVICNVPDVTTFPYFNTIAYNALEISADQAETLNLIFGPMNNGTYFQEGPNGFIIEDTTQTYGVRQIQEGELISLAVPLDSIKCHGMGSITPIPQEYVLDSTEISFIKARVSEYNLIIESLAAQYNIAVADINSVYQSAVNEFIYNGVSTNAEFVTGGFFSLDGRNPSPKGNAAIANEIIKAINIKYNAKIPYCDLGDYYSVKFP